jgi:hypothetical protein
LVTSVTKSQFGNKKEVDQGFKAGLLEYRLADGKPTRIVKQQRKARKEIVDEESRIDTPSFEASAIGTWYSRENSGNQPNDSSSEPVP